MSHYTPLDPEEGPTIWAKVTEDNKHTYELVVGTDPEDPSKRILISDREIGRLNEISNEE